MATALSFLPASSASSLLTPLWTAIWAPLQAVVLFFAPHAVVPIRCITPAVGSSLGTASQHGLQATRDPGMHPPYRSIAYPQVRQKSSVSQHNQPVRIVRVAEAGISADKAGLIRMSGRFADVCAELDRMAACPPRSLVG